jgi:hypothetical protein
MADITPATNTNGGNGRYVTERVFLNYMHDVRQDIRDLRDEFHQITAEFRRYRDDHIPRDAIEDYKDEVEGGKKAQRDSRRWAVVLIGLSNLMSASTAVLLAKVFGL